MSRFPTIEHARGAGYTVCRVDEDGVLVCRASESGRRYGWVARGVRGDVDALAFPAPNSFWFPRL